ncbi:hypothetical protein [Rhodococcus sp. IEGM 1318]|uniref:hypothetical protein n=1 Tax=Rhodococcus sp. IEGM 1318 TaxID=3082226 RepID=UPI002954946B|nr:hypothetical protein [Rhodococcus sp. IEGM 1318]MDV8008961.1 hypothetical protein [Rhodococcus sp. IEGM 1318]
MAELVGVAEGDLLKVEYRSDPSPTVGVFRMLAGGVTSPTQLGALSERLGELLPCLKQLDFVATVDKVDGGDTRVTVRPA